MNALVVFLLICAFVLQSEIKRLQAREDTETREGCDREHD